MGALNDLFVDMARETSATEISHPNKGYLNLVQSPHYTSAFLIGGKTEKELFNVGHTLAQTVMFETVDASQRFGSGGVKVDFTNPQIGTKLTANMSYLYNHIGWNESEVEGNLDLEMGMTYIRSQFNDIMEGKHQNLYQVMADVFENESWGAANQQKMRVDGSLPMSIPYYITEETNGLPLQADGSAMTDVLGESPVTYSNHDNVRATYANLGGKDIAGDDLIGSLLDARTRADFEPLPMNSEYGIESSIPNVVFCSNYGLKVLTAAYRHGQDKWAPNQSLTAHGIPLDGMMIRNITALDSAALFAANGGGALVAETAADITGARFWGTSSNSMQVKFQKGKYMNPDAPVNLTIAGVPYEWVQGYKTTNQLWCTSRKKNFIVSPSVAL